jgi:hypothetical protein
VKFVYGNHNKLKIQKHVNNNIEEMYQHNYFFKICFNWNVYVYIFIFILSLKLIFYFIIQSHILFLFYLVDSYLSFAAGLFSKDPRLYSEERALNFLHLCSYNIPIAINLLKCCEPPPEEEDEEEYYICDDFCGLCRDGGNLIVCDVENCKKVFHPACVKLESIPTGKW